MAEAPAQSPKHPRDIVVVGGSAGAIPAVTAILEVLPPDFAAAVMIVLHRRSDPSAPYRLTEVLASETELRVHTAYDEQPIERGHIYLAPNDEQLVLQNGLIRLEHSPRENWSRPTIDVLFKSAAATYGRRVIGVLLSGAGGSDGSAGLWQIKHRGGVTIVQDPRDARFPNIPKGALDNVNVDHVLPVNQIGPLIVDLASPASLTEVARPPRIVIVEDESVVASNLQQRLREMGYDVIDWVPTGEAAVDVAEREHPDLIIMDIRLAGALTGIEAARRIWQRLQIPIVYSTAHTDLETLKAVQTTESYGYLVKPCQSPAVQAAVELALARREKELR